MLTRIWLKLRHAGWFSPNRTAGAIFPFPETWQGWATTGAFIVLLTLTVFLPPEPAWLCRMGLSAGYIGLGVLTYE